MEISKANLSDSTEVGALLVDAWRDAYKGIMSPSFLDNLSKQKRSEGWRKYLEEEPNVYVLRNGSNVLGVLGVLGVVGVCKFRDGINRYASYSEITVLYLQPKIVGKGFGSMLLNYAHEKIAEFSVEGVALWVFEKNTVAIDFYKKHGYSYSGENKLHNTGLVEHLYTKSAYTGR